MGRGSGYKARGCGYNSETNHASSERMKFIFKFAAVSILELNTSVVSLILHCL